MPVNLWKMWLRPKRHLSMYIHMYVYVSKSFFPKLMINNQVNLEIKFVSPNLKCDSKSMINIWKYIWLIGNIIPITLSLPFFKKETIDTYIIQVSNPKLWNTGYLILKRILWIDWQIKISKLEFVWRWLWHPEIMEFEFPQPVFLKLHILA